MTGDNPHWLKFDDDSTDELDETPPANASQGPLSDELDQEYVKELKAARKFRKALVPFTKWCVAGVLIAAVVVMVLYVCSEWGELHPAVMLGFFTSVIVETLGILYIISTYLFPRGGAKRGEGNGNGPKD